MGGDDSEEEFLQIKSVVPNGPAWLDSRLKTGETEQRGRSSSRSSLLCPMARPGWTPGLRQVRQNSEEEFLKIKSVLPNGPALLDSRLKTGETEQIRTHGPGGTETHPVGPETKLFTIFLFMFFES